MIHLTLPLCRSSVYAWSSYYRSRRFDEWRCRSWAYAPKAGNCPGQASEFVGRYQIEMRSNGRARSDRPAYSRRSRQ